MGERTSEMTAVEGQRTLVDVWSRHPGKWFFETIGSTLSATQDREATPCSNPLHTSRYKKN